MSGGNPREACPICRTMREVRPHNHGQPCRDCAHLFGEPKHSDELAYQGGWIRRGLVLVPTAPRPPDKLGHGPGFAPREHGTEKGYLQHRSHREASCEPCRKAHAAHERERYREAGAA